MADISDETIDIPVLLHDSVIYRCAQLVYMTLGDDAGANRMAELLKE